MLVLVSLHAGRLMMYPNYLLINATPTKQYLKRIVFKQNV